MGLHRSSAVQRQDGANFTPIEIEERRRTFWGIYHLDATISLILGRPTLLSDAYVDAELPEAVHDLQITANEIVQGQAVHNDVLYLHESLRGMSIQLRNICQKLYSVEATSNRAQSDLAIDIHTVDMHLLEWRNSLPTELQCPHVHRSQQFVHASQQRLYYWMAYYLCQCLIFRPAVDISHRLATEQQEAQPSPTGRRRQGSRVAQSSTAGADNLKDSAERCIRATRDLLQCLAQGTNIYASGHILYLPPCQR